MSLSLRLDLRQSQSLVMTPQLQQAIKLLQLPNLELAAYVQQELEQNPLLAQPDSGGDGDGPEPEDGAPPGELGDRPLSGDVALAPGAEPGDGWSGTSEDGWADSTGPELPTGLGMDRVAAPQRGGSTDFGDRSRSLEASFSRPPTLRDHLIEQLQVDLPPGPDRAIGLELIEAIDEAGYLRESVAELAARMACPAERVAAVLARLQHFDPPGVFARSLEECLALQLRDADRLDPAMVALLDHLDLVAHADFPALIRVCGVLPDDLPEMLAELKALNPRPGLAFAVEPVDAVVPDVFVTPTPDGGWRVELNDATLPRVLIDRSYHVELSRRLADREARAYLSERLQAANWLVKALDQRARTLLKVAEAVVERQQPFLRHGVQHLRPLVLRDIAEATGLHESTVSRATADKWVATPRGTLPFRAFFSIALPATDGEASHSAAAIRQQIKTMVEREDPARVLSDDQIVAALQADGIAIARRTVAKYRESMAIPSSVQRRRTKALRLA